MSAPIVIDQTIADRLGPLPERFTVVRRRRLRWPLRGRSCAWRPLDPECVLEVLAGLAEPGWALVRPIENDCGARCLAAGAALLGHDVIRLPAAFDEAVWCVGVALRISESSDETLERVMDVVCCGPGAVPQSPRQPWGPTGLAVPALRPTTLARWAYCAWRPCGWCDGGGLAGHTCRRCGVLIDLVAAEVVA
jgi:hypothetical protein